MSSPPAKTTKHVLLIGLNMPWARVHFSEQLPDHVLNALNATFARLEQEPNLSIGKHGFIPHDAVDMANVKDRLRLGPHDDGRAKWDGVLIGWGIRANLQFTDDFQELVNAVVQELPGVPIVFSRDTADHLGAIRKNVDI